MQSLSSEDIDKLSRRVDKRLRERVASLRDQATQTSPTRSRLNSLVAMLVWIVALVCKITFFTLRNGPLILFWILVVSAGIYIYLSYKTLQSQVAQIYNNTL